MMVIKNNKAGRNFNGHRRMADGIIRLKASTIIEIGRCVNVIKAAFFN